MERITKKTEKKAQKKIVRKDMLRKLIKYDFRYIFKILIPFLSAAVVLSLLNVVVVLVTQRRENNGSLFIVSFVQVFYGMFLGYTPLVALVLSGKRFHQNLFTAEGYLTLSIPATPEEHLLSKFLSGFISILGSCIICALAELPTMAIGRPWEETVLGMLCRLCETSGSPVFTGIEIVFLILGIIVSVMQMYSVSACGGHIFSKKTGKDGGVAFACVFVIVMVIYSVVASILLVALFSVLPDGDGTLLRFFELIGVHGVLWLIIIFLFGFSVGCWFIDVYILKKKINLV